MRLLWALCGGLSLSLGIIGVFLPLVPTVPLVLLAAFCFSRSSQVLHDWLLEHAVFGPTIQDWRENGAISLRGKRLATVSIVAVLSLSVFANFDAWIIVVQACVLGAVMLFIWTRPTGSSKAGGTTHRVDPETDSE